MPAQPEKTRPYQRPKDAATLILYRRAARGLEVLMGERHGNHAFMPNRYVFPGGGVDRDDWRVRAALPLRPEVRLKLERAATAARAQALAMAAVREMFEETGLILGAPDPQPKAAVPESWAAFFATGFAPALDGLDYILRAVTPPARSRRFNARFFIADAAQARGEIKGSGELLDLRWVTVEDARQLQLPQITMLVLSRLETLLGTPDRSTVAAFTQRYGKHVEFEE